MKTARVLSMCAVAAAAVATSGRAAAQSEFIPATTVMPPGLHFEFANTDGTGGNTQFSMFGTATHADWSPPDPPALHTLVIVFEWRIGPGPEHDDTNWAQSPDNITTVIGGMGNPFSTGTFTTPGAWDTVAVHMYCGFPITVTGFFDHSWTSIPSPATLPVLGCAGLACLGRRRSTAK